MSNLSDQQLQIQIALAEKAGYKIKRTGGAIILNHWTLYAPQGDKVAVHVDDNTNGARIRAWEALMDYIPIQLKLTGE